MILKHQARIAIEAYANGVADGSIVVCEMVRKAVERYFRDCEKSQTEEFPYYFDELRASVACEFFPLLLRHSKGEHSGKPFELSGWQAFVIWNLFGWRRADGTRRFRRAFISVARKNGKSTLCAGIALLLAFADEEAGAEVYIGATKIDQAAIIHTEAERMLRQSPYLAKLAEQTKNCISIPSTNSVIRPLGSDKPFDGLNPHGVFFDELHAWQEYHRKFYATMNTGSGARSQPLSVTITTAGDDTSLIYREECEYARSVLHGDWQDDKLFAMIFELDEGDDYFDESVWIKANPNLGTSMRAEAISDIANQAKRTPQKRAELIRYHCNRCVSSLEAPITREVWDAAAGELSDWSEADAIGAGFDLGGRDDLAAFSLVARFVIGERDDKPLYRYESQTWCYMAEDCRRDLTQEPWATWIEQGLVSVSKYAVSDLQARLIQECEAWGVQVVAYDPYQAAQLAEQLELEGLMPVKMPQNHSQFNEPITSWIAAITEGRFRPNQADEVLRWCMLNAAFNRNPQDRVMFDKRSSKEKIDAAVAMMMAFRACNAAESAFKGTYFIS